MIDAEQRKISLEISIKEFKACRKRWKPMEPRYTPGVLANTPDLSHRLPSAVTMRI
jgi:hypothetical protein